MEIKYQTKAIWKSGNKQVVWKKESNKGNMESGNKERENGNQVIKKDNMEIW